jgi:hypothetical protein
VVNCSHAFTKKKDKKEQEKANQVKQSSHKTGEETPAQETDQACEESDQEEASEEEDILEGKPGPQEKDPSPPRTTVGVFLGQKRPGFG